MTRSEFVEFVKATFNAMDMITPAEGAAAVIKAFDEYEVAQRLRADALAPPTDTEAYIRELVDEIRRLKAALDAAQSLTQRMERQHVAIHLDAAGRATTVWECVRCEIRPSCTERHVYLDSDVDALRACADALAPQRKACPECKHPWHDSYCPVPTSPSEIAAFPHTCGCLAHEDRADALAPPEPQGQVVWLIERVQAMQINGKATYWSGDEELPPGGETTDPWDACWFPRKQDAARVAVGRFGKNLARSGWQIVEHVFSAPPEPKPEKKQWDVDQMCEEHALTDCRWCFGGLPAPPRADALNAAMPNDDEDRDKGTEFPRLKGQCPACGNNTLFRGSKGYITCSWLKCPNPGAGHDAMVRADALAPPEPQDLERWRTFYRALAWMVNDYIGISGLSTDFTQKHERLGYAHEGYHNARRVMREHKPPMPERLQRFNDGTACLSGGNSHPDRCVCQEKEAGVYAGTPHKHYDEPPYSCARCHCKAYKPALPAPPRADALAPAPEKGDVMELPDVEVVAAKVHEAWMETKRAQGIVSRPAADGTEQMVPYAELPDALQELDRSTVRAVYAAIESSAK